MRSARRTTCRFRPIGRTPPGRRGSPRSEHDPSFAGTWAPRTRRPRRSRRRLGSSPPMATTTIGGREGVLGTLTGSARRRRKERAVEAVLVAAAGLSVVISVAIVLALLFRTLTFVSKVDLGALWAGVWRPRQGQFDLLSLVYGSTVVTAIAMIVATPLGLGAAAYLSEYARPSIRRVLKPIIETLAGIPSVVIGFFALTLINPTIVQGVFGATGTF